MIRSPVHHQGIYVPHSDFNYDPEKTEEEDGYGVSARVAYVPARERWDLAVSGENPTDTAYAVFRSGSALFGARQNLGTPLQAKVRLNAYF